MKASRITLSTLTAAGCAFAMSQASLGDVIGFEDFDGGAINLSGALNVFDYNGGGGSVGDVFGRVSPAYLGGTGAPFDVADDSAADVSGGGMFGGDTTGIIGQNSTAIFAINDADGPDGPGFTEAIWSFNITSATSLTNIAIDLGAKGDFENASSDGFRIEAQIDGGGYQTIFLAESNDLASYTYRANDAGVQSTLNDPLELFIDGSGTPTGFLDKSDATTGLMDTYLSTLFSGASGSSLDIRVSWAGTPSGGEPMGIDNITINGLTPAPGALAILLVAGLAVRRRRRG